MMTFWKWIRRIVSGQPRQHRLTHLEKMRIRANSENDQELAEAAEWVRRQVRRDYRSLLSWYAELSEGGPDAIRGFSDGELMVVSKLARIGFHEVTESVARLHNELIEGER